MKIFGRYNLIKNGLSIICCPTELNREYDSQDEFFSQAWHMSFTKVEERDLSFISDIMQICRECDYYSFAIMDEKISNKVLNHIVKIAKECFSESKIQIIFPVNVASKYNLPDDVFVGSFFVDNSTTLAQSFNAGTLNFSRYRALLPEANRISKEIKKMELDELESIIWIDNWFQNNIQYIKDRKTTARGEEYICPSIKKQAVVSDVLLHHYGTCEDITASIATILSLINIEYLIVQANAHAWLHVNLNNTYYI